MKEGMEANKKNSKENPWAFGDEAEKIVKGEEEKAGAEVMQSLQDKIEQSVEKAQNDFHEELLTSSDQKKQESFEVDGFGILKIDEHDAAPSLWQSIEPTGDNGRLEKGMEPGYTGEDLMRSAMQLQKKFPDIEFAFKDERPKRFTYTATLRESK